MATKDPFIPPSVPPPSPLPPRSNVPMLYYGLVVVGTTALILAVYNIVIIRWCSEQQYRHQARSGQSLARASRPATSTGPNVRFVSSFKYKKEKEKEKEKALEQGYESECAVCLSVFEEGEEVRRLPRCRHCFHSPCIDMWLYSHLNCPLCRAPVEPPVLWRQKEAERPENSQGGLLDAGVSPV